MARTQQRNSQTVRQCPQLRVLTFAPKPPSTLQEKIARLETIRPYSAQAVELLVDEVLADAERTTAQGMGEE